MHNGPERPKEGYLMTASTGYTEIEPFQVWWRANQPHEIHLVSSNPLYNSADGQHPGLWVTFSCNPKSANYHPQNFNRLARALVASDKPAPAEVPEHDRRLNQRSKWIAWWNKEQPTA